MATSYKKLHSLEKRTADSERIRTKFPERIPVICEKSPDSDIAAIDKQKYLVPGDLTVCQFMCVIRKRIKLEPEKAMFFFVNDSRNNHNVAPLQSALLSAIYDQYKDEDGFLYITYSGETTFG
mmetsp:Transcript_29925/g.39326  ORF Transcript_29925/g.39326 Transcript_29925/m.39326 type:complete len:123 (-) Transcript_29925:241-609(-)|eukprot:CAMPEP_0117758480 /NCGR_PEP_ID=MMETSP0947-20121206/15406_1 /TAXON_ID=44440 /ORGANISM="Chattonella subsalsa, Strain CCMP2191" /LENGTH=122 /DNA_ID=CAMNT_0005578681 /DNA_START=130 /DNA_END=498 /DNA_ORIENTATION=+